MITTETSARWHRAGRPLDHRALRWLPLVVGLVSLGLGAVACVCYARADLQLSHYDARGHLVVARRVIDSITPGWRQIGAVWLPLPHLLNLVPVQVDAFYRTGLSAIAISMLAFAAATYACSRIILEATGSRLAAVAGTLVLALNPDVLYLQATPMTEPLLLGLMTLSVLALFIWIARGATRHQHLAGWLLAASCLCRYEAWPATVAALAAGTLAIRWQGRRWRDAIRAIAVVAAYPAASVLGFIVVSRVTVGEWLVSTGFFVPDNPDMGRPFEAAASVWWGTHQLSGYGPLLLGVAGLLMLIVAVLRSRAPAGLLVFIALAGAAVLPWYAFVSGHPFRIRYMVPLIPAVAVFAGIGVGLARRARWIAAALLLACVAVETAPFHGRSPMVLEAQWDRDNARGRRAVTACLEREYRGEKIMASMGSLGHYMQELSREGLALRDFLHEGNGDIWLAALKAGPRTHVGWVLIEETAEGGDMLAVRARLNPRFLRGFSRICEGGGVALYRRTSLP